MRVFAVVLLALGLGCAHRPAASAAPAGAPGSAPAGATAAAAVPAPDAAELAGEEDGPEDEEADAPAPEETESREATPGMSNAPLYTKELSDLQLETAWKSDPDSLGAISIGFADEGRLINGKQFPRGEGWTVVSPEKAWGTEETLANVQRAIAQVRALHPNIPPLRVNQISVKEGGYIRPHKSHQSGRDVDLAFYYPSADPLRRRERERVIDVALTWELLKSLITLTDVQLVLVDRRVQKVLYEYALKRGEDRPWLDSIFRAPTHRLIQHARHHRDHFHVRFYNPRAQELGRRVAPLLAQRPDQNLLMHRVHQGDTLGAIARRYGSSVESIKKSNHLRNSFLHLAQVLRIPMRGPCTHCPVPPPFVVPPRHLPPGMETAAVAATEPVPRLPSELPDAPPLLLEPVLPEEPGRGDGILNALARLPTFDIP